MEHFIDRIVGNPLHIVIAVVILAVLGFAIIKKVSKLVLVGVIVLAGFVAYVYFTGDDPRGAVKSAVEEGKDALKR